MQRISTVILVVLATLASAQDIQVSRQNKSIAVTAEESVTVDPEVAIITAGYHTYAATRDAAFQDNVRVSDQVLHALLDAHVPKESIETRQLELGRVDPEEKWTPEMKKDRQFEARQSWTIRIPTSQAAALVDVALQAGANEVNGVTWDVVDGAALQARASGAALAKARSIAEQMAKGLGAKLGDLVYASNKSPAQEDKFERAYWKRDLSLTIITKSGTGRPKVEIYPEKVKSTATAYAVFAIE